MDNSWAHPVEKVLRDFDVSIEQGLSDEEAVLRQQKYGKNCLTSKDATPFWKLVLEQFEDPLVRILLTAAIISFILAIFEDGEEQLTAFFEPLVIFLILIANAIVGVLQETNAEKAIEALKQFEPETAVVTRSGEEKTINAEDLVPGDIVTVAVGKTVPADIRVVKIQTITFRIDQKLLTGESDPVNKVIDAIPDPDSLQGKRNTMFKGTNCTTGQAKGVVVGIGQHTEIGKIKETIENTEEVQSPLQQKLEEFSELLTKVIGVICIAVWAINIRQFSAPEHGGLVRGAVYYFKIAVALAVAAIPEGLPAVVTTCLALGTVKMAKKNAIVRHLPSVETLGCTSVICSDKTGTLTTSKMSVCHAVVVGSVSSGSGVQLLEFNVDGTTYDPIGSITDLGRDSLVDGFASYPALRESAIVCSLCNNSRLNYDPLSKKVDTMGEPTELALRVFSEKINNGGKPVNDYSILSSQLDADFEKLATLEFSRDRKSMSVLVRHKGSHLLLVKGAPESLLERCNRVLLNETGKPVPLTNEIKEQLTKSLTDMSHRALRVLGFAIVPEALGVDEYDFSPEKYGQYESNMVFVGMAGMLDPPRPEVKAALATCRKAGIDVIVITGDNKNTAEAICRKIGLFSADEDLSRRSLTGRDWDALDEAQKIEMLKTVRLFSRTEPVHKSDIVQLLQRQKNVVAMTGDGVNDAPALKIANIGIGMGSGTDVAKAASDMILADDNFATIVSAVEEGRAIYSNTKQFIRYLISSNIGEVACIFITAALGIPEALIPVQLLWVNLVTDGLPATALGFNPPDLDIMEKPPRSSSERIINGWMFFRYMVIGLYVGIATVGGFLYWYTSYENGPLLSLELLKLHDKCVGELRPGLSCSDFVAMNRVPSTIALSVLVTIEMFNAINSLSESQSLIRMPPWRNWWLIGAVLLSFSLHFVIVYIPFFASVFQVAPISLEEWYIVLAFSFPVVIIDEVFKLFSRLLAKHHE